ncbi:MAG: MBG domain-containing protein [Cyclobacteriaceae bacterium]
MDFSPRISSALFLLIFSIHFSFAQQDYYWVGGSGNWSDVSHWATTSGGTTNHAVAPTELDNVYFDANSFSGSGQSVTIDAAAVCHDFDWTGATNFPAINASDQLDIYGSAVMNTDVDYNLDEVYFKSSDMGETITTSGVSFGTSCTLRFDGTGGWSLDGNLDTYRIYFTKGTFSTANYDITTSNTIYVTSTTGNLLDLNLGSSTINCQTFWNSSASDLDLDAGTSEIITGQLRGDLNGNGPFTYYDITFEDGGSLYNVNNLNVVTLLAGTLYVEAGSVQSLNDFVAGGDKYSDLQVKTFSEGTEATFSASSGTIDIDFVTLQDIHATGGATFNATNSIDNGNNDGWTITAPAGENYYWVGDGGDWDDPTHWATTSGGSTFHTDYPSKYDNVFFDANSFTQASQTVNIDIPEASFKDMDWTGVTNNPTFYAPYESQVKAYGNVIFTEEMTKSIYNGGGYGDETGLEFHYGGGSIQNFSFRGTGEYTMYDEVNCGNFNIYGGSVNLGDVTINVSFTFNIQSSDSNVDLGSAVINTRDFKVVASGTTTIVSGTSQIIITRDFYGDDFSFNHLTMTGNGSISGSNTFSTLELDPGVNISLTDGTTQTVSNLLLTGTKASPINLSSSSPGSQATLSVASGTVAGIYLILQDIVATGGATFNADQTIDNGNNTGWNITSVTSQDYYWVGGSGNWSDFANHWATTSGGSTFHTGEPGVLDNVYLDANSFSSTDDELTIDYSSISMNTLDMSGMDVGATISGDAILNIYGSLNISPLAVFYPDEIHLLSDESVTISAKNPYLYTSGEFFFEGPGTFMLTDTLKVRELTISNGTFVTDNNYVNISFSTRLDGDNAIVMDLGTSEFVSRSLTNGTATNYIIDASAATMVFSSSFSPDYSNSNDVTINDLIIRQSNGTDDGRIEHDITVNNLIVEAGSAITIRSGATVTATQIEMVGTAEDPIILSCSVEGEVGTLSQATGTVEAEYLEIKDNIATGGATFNAYSSVNLGNASGWTFFKTEQTIDFPAISDKAYDDDPFTLEATASSGLAVEYEVLSGPATVEGNTLTLDGSIGIVQVKASQPGDIDYYPAQSVINEFEVIGYDQEITFPELAPATYGDGPIDLLATSTYNLKITYSSSDASVVTIDDQLNELIIQGAGEATITAMQVGNDSVSVAADVEQVIAISKADLTITADNQTISFGDPLPEFTYAISGFEYDDTEADLDTPVTIETSATEGSAIGSYEITLGGATSQNYNITLIDASLEIEKRSQVITFDPPTSVNIADGTLDLEASVDSDLPLTFELESGPATLSGNTLTFTGTGELVIHVSQAGDDNHFAAETVIETVIVTDGTKTDQSITFNTISDKKYGDSFSLAATATSGLSVTYTVTEGPGEITGSSLKVTGVGSITIRASQVGNDVFNPATSVTQTFSTTKAPLTITADDKTKTYGEGNPALTISYSGFVNGDDEDDITPPSIGTTAGMSSDAGEYDITLTGGSADNYDITKVNGTLTVEKAEATITITNLEQEADGTEKIPTISTDPDGLAYSVTYDGSTTAPVDVGDYILVVTISDANYQGEVTETFSLTSVLGTSFVEAGIKVFPNPTVNYVEVRGIEKGNLTILDLQGKVVLTKEIAPRIDLGSLTSGNYILKVENLVTEKTSQFRLIKKH